MGKSKQIKAKKQTPLMQQYMELKNKYPDAILLFRVGDFYETFGSDANAIADLLGITLTKRNNGGSDIALAGFPYHSLDTYLPKLVKAGLRVAICEQLEKPSPEKKIVKRGITEIITPGLNTNDELLDQKENNFLAAVASDPQSTQAGLALLDYSTGEFLCYQGDVSHVNRLLHNYHPKEILYSKGSSLIPFDLDEAQYTYPLESWIFDSDYCQTKLQEAYQVQSLEGFGIADLPLGITACGVILNYLQDTKNQALGHLQNIRRLIPENFLWLDANTLRNLELLHPLQSNGSSLFQIMNQCSSPMGSRLLRRWLIFPLLELTQIKKRQQYTTFFIGQRKFLSSLKLIFKQIGDVERLMARYSTGRISPRHIMSLRQTLDGFEQMIQAFDGVAQKPESKELMQGFTSMRSLLEQIQAQFNDELPAILGKEEIIRHGFDPELDEYIDMKRNAKQYLLDIQQREIANTGISNLKIGFNNVFGYYLEVTNKYKNSGLVPEDWIRKQTLTNSERYITDELKTLEDKILSAEERINAIERRMFDDFLLQIQPLIAQILNNARIVAEMDCYMSFAQIAQAYGYVCPELSERDALDIVEGRHPVIERNMQAGTSYVPNDLHLDQSNNQIMLISGPNMSGKSAILRQTALICIMAQMGSFVPAKSAMLDVLDRIFTRVGASDNISSGESTFMVEMNETANILNNLSNKSLILLDEIGRGTSTFDGISIAWSILEFIHQLAHERPYTLFATHYHELSELETRFDRIHNFHVSTKEVGNKVHFLRKLLPGSVAHSFGIYVARMAGMPKQVLTRAEAILQVLEQQSVSGEQSKTTKSIQSIAENSVQLQMFQMDDPELIHLRNQLIGIDINSLTPVECMLKLKEMQSRLSKATNEVEE